MLCSLPKINHYNSDATMSTTNFSIAVKKRFRGSMTTTETFLPKRIPSKLRVPKLVGDQIYLLCGRHPAETTEICYVTTRSEELAQKLVYPDHVLGEWSRCTTYYPDLEMARRILLEDNSLDGEVYEIQRGDLEAVTAAQWCIVLEFQTQ